MMTSSKGHPNKNDKKEIEKEIYINIIILNILLPSCIVHSRIFSFHVIDNILASHIVLDIRHYPGSTLVDEHRNGSGRHHD